MTDDKRFFDHGEHAAPPAMSMLPPPEWAALPMTVRVADHLVQALVIASEIRADLGCEEAAPLAWVVPEIDDMVDQIDRLLQRLAS
ncbi:MAG: hypothetical protein ACXW5U_26025 [Thermoanaerobaculia bacterium]